MDPVAEMAQLVVEFQKQVEVLDDDVGQVRKTWNPYVEVQFQVWLE